MLIKTINWGITRLLLRQIFPIAGKHVISGIIPDIFKCFLDIRKHLVHTFLMTGKDLLKTIIIDSQQRAVPEVWERTLKIPTESGKIVTLSGVRRSGKTYHL